MQTFHFQIPFNSQTPSGPLKGHGDGKKMRFEGELFLDRKNTKQKCKRTQNH